MFENKTASDIDTLHNVLREAQLAGVAAQLSIPEQYKVARETLGDDVTGSRAVAILHTQHSVKAADAVRAVAASHLINIYSAYFARTAQELTKQQLGKRYLDENVSLWEKEEIENVLLDTHEDLYGEEAHDELLDSSDNPFRSIAELFTRSA